MNKRFLFPEVAALPTVYVPPAQLIKEVVEMVALQEVVEVSTIYPDGRVEHVATYYGDIIVVPGKKVNIYI